MHTEFRGRCTYQAESDKHFPHLTVEQTLEFATQARAPPMPLLSSLGKKYHNREVYEESACALGIQDTLETKVGNDFIRGVSGGERKRTSIAVGEIALSSRKSLTAVQEILVTGSSLQCWDNSTRGLDSANALQFVKTVRDSTRKNGSAAVMTIYQVSQDIYNVSLRLRIMSMAIR